MATDIIKDKISIDKFKNFDDLKTHLSNIPDKNDSERNLYDHLGEIIDHIVLHCPDQSLDKLEEISYLIKKNDPKLTD